MSNRIEVKRGNGGVSHIIFDRVEKSLAEMVEGKKNVVVITDENLLAHYGNIISKFKYIVLGQGEENKNLSTVEMIYSKLLEFGADRHTYIVGFGGGIVTDITGFAASTYQRGLNFGFVATSLLSQVDASVGGKNGVNFEGLKNMIGVFNQPDFVICDAQMLSTLPERELRAGLAEIIKGGIIKNSALFEFFEEYSYQEITSNIELLQQIIKESVKIKAQVVEEDERESGERKKLNFGHTFAHAIEKSSRQFVHGEAVAIGMIFAAELSLKKGFLAQTEYSRIVNVIKKMGFETNCGIETTKLCSILTTDKKRNNDTIDFIVATKIGGAQVVNMGFEQINTLFSK